jgi:hypothetical protein
VFRSAKTDNVEYDFGTRIVALRTKKEVVADKGGYWLQRAKIRRVGDQFFLTGEACDNADGAKNPYRGVVFWFMLSEIEQMREYPDLDSAWKSWRASLEMSATGITCQPGLNTGESAKPPATADRPRD